MGGGISWLFSFKDITVLMKDLSWDAVGIGYQSAMGMYKKLVQIRKLRQAQVNVKMHKITGTVDYAGFADVDIAVEAIVENMDVKKKVLAELEQELSKEAILVTNTSALSVTEMGTALKKATRFCGMHFFNPVNRMPLVEVIPGEKTNNATIAAVVALCKRLGKTPVVVQDCPGFLVNRILIPYVNEAAHLLAEGSGMLSLDQRLKDFGLPMGPFELADEVGLDVGFKVAHILEEGYGERMKVAPLLPVLFEGHQLLGKKSGNGFYTYDGKNKSINPALRSIVGNYQKTHGLKPVMISEDDCVDRCILIMVNEAARCMQEEIVESAEYLDMAMIMGTGFPPFRGGLLRYADSRGIASVVDRLQELAQKYGNRFEPCQLLVDMAEQKLVFHN